MNLSEVEKQILCEVAGIDGVPEGAYNFRINGKSVNRRSTDNIEVCLKKDGSGLDIYIKAGIKNEAVHIPVIISATGIKEVVYNDFHIGEGAEVLIVAGCGIYNCGGVDSVHDGIHRFYVGENASVKYIEKHYGFGPGKGGKILNPVTALYLEEGSKAVLEMEQIKGVDSTMRVTEATLKDNASLVVKERLMTHGRQKAESKYDVKLTGENSAVDIVSRAVAQDYSVQTFRSRILGNAKCKGHSECDAIVMDEASVLAEPSLEVKDVRAELVHEAAIGKIAHEQLIKLMTLGLTQKEAEAKIINGFLR